MIPREYLDHLAAALAIATGTLDGVAGMAAAGRLPRLGDAAPPWEVRGWLLPHAMDLLPPETGVGRGRWRYWLRIQLGGGELPEDPIPQVPFVPAEDGSKTEAGRMLSRCVDLIADRGSRYRLDATEALIDWLAWALHVSDLRPRIEPAVQERLYRPGGFCLDPLLAAPADYFGWLLSECKGRGADPRGFYPTPYDVVRLMGEMTWDGGDERALAVCDPCVGTGRMLLWASNRSLRLSGQDIDGRCVRATLVNGALFAPWIAFPFPAELWERAGERSAPPPAFDGVGQGLLFGP